MEVRQVTLKKHCSRAQCSEEGRRKPALHLNSVNDMSLSALKDVRGTYDLTRLQLLLLLSRFSCIQLRVTP